MSVAAAFTSSDRPFAAHFTSLTMSCQFRGSFLKAAEPLCEILLQVLRLLGQSRARGEGLLQLSAQFTLAHYPLIALLPEPRDLLVFRSTGYAVAGHAAQGAGNQHTQQDSRGTHRSTCGLQIGACRLSAPNYTEDRACSVALYGVATTLSTRRGLTSGGRADSAYAEVAGARHK